MAKYYIAVIVGAVSLCLYYLIIHLSRRSLARSLGCQPPPKRPARDPLLAIDLKMQDAKASKVLQSLPEGTRRFRQLGRTFRSTTILGTSLKTMHAENIQAVFSSKGKDWGIQPFRLAAMTPFCGAGFITTDGAVWEHSRALLKPTFHKGNISDLTAFESSVKLMQDRIPKDGSTIDMQPLLSIMFVDTSTKFLLGQSLGMLASGEASDSPVDGKAFLKAFQLSLRSMGIRLYLGPLRFMLPKSAGTLHWQVVHEFIDFYVDRALQTIKSEAKDSSHNVQARHRSLLDVLAEQTPDRIEIRNQIIQGMMAAQDTTAILISNSLFLLARNPAVWERLRNETTRAGSKTLTPEDIKGFNLLRNILHESLRLYPVFPTLLRVALKDTVLPAGGGLDGKHPIFAPAGTTILADFYSLHRDEAIYGPDVEAFNPDRWNSINPSAWQYLAFGGGLRACLGQQKAMLEASCTLIRLTQAFKSIHSRDDREWAGDQKLVARNANGCHIAFTPA